MGTTCPYPPQQPWSHVWKQHTNINLIYICFISLYHTTKYQGRWTSAIPQQRN
jgi:hypothetical protein